MFETNLGFFCAFGSNDDSLAFETELTAEPFTKEEKQLN